MGKTFLIAGILCLLYFAGIAVYTGMASKFNFAWLLLGGVFLLLARAEVRQMLVNLPLFVKAAGLMLFGLLLAAMVFLGSLIAGGMFSEGQAGLDYVIVLGAKVNGTVVSRALKQRLDCAAEYLLENPDTQVIVSGGKGPDEGISEALAMETYLLEAGIAEERIQKEDRSTSTAENIAFSKKLLEKEDASVGVITNSYHVFRAVSIAKKQGVSAEGIAAKSDAAMLPAYFLREIFAVFKDWYVGNLSF